MTLPKKFRINAEYGSWPVKRDDIGDLIVSTTSIIREGVVEYYETMVFVWKGGKIDWDPIYEVRHGDREDVARRHHEQLVTLINLAGKVTKQ